MSSSSSTKICYNPDCKESILERSRKGWRLRSGDFVELCGRCASAFEDGRFCKTFHANSAGWRDCESCRKPLHCGCIVSVHEFVLLDVGGVECMPCASKHLIMSSNQIWPSPSSFMPRTLSERLKDFPVVDWNVVNGSNAIAGQWWHPPNMQISASIKSELHRRMSNDVERLSTSSKEKGKHEVPSERVMSSGLELTALSSRAANGNSGDMVAASNTFNKEEGLAYDVLPDSGVNISRQPSTSKDDSSTPHIGSAVTYTSSIDTNGPTRVSETQSQRQTPPPPLVKQFNGHSQNGVDSSGETQVRNGKQRGDARGKAQLLPRYWPRITDQELQQISGDSNSVITPLFEKMLSASDAGRIGRLVLPKKCAEAYFPAISQSEGLPLKVQDAKGKEWTFQFRFWPNNNSRMYVLEGVTPCIQSMQLQAGDTVTFSRIDPDGKLVMGFRKASSNVPPSDQGNRTLKTGNGVSTNAEVNSTHTASTWSKVDKSAYIAKEVHSAKSSLIPSKRKSSTLGSKSKRLRIENEDMIEIKLTWEQAQGLLRPPPSHVPSIVVIEGHEFEEYEEAPILGKPTVLATNNFGEKVQWVQCEDCSKWRKLPVDALLPSRWICSDNKWDPKRSSCSSDQEITTEQVENLLSSSNADASKKMKSARKDSVEVEPSDGLDTLADLAIMGESKVSTSSAQPTTRHPRHRPGCTCIVCIQPPSGKGPKHRETCTCNVCLTVKRRFRTLMERRGKRQPEKDAENSQKKHHHHQQQPEKLEPEDDLTISSNTSSNMIPKIEANGTTAEDDYNRKKQLSPFKGQIDLNIQPEREDEPSPVADPGNMMRLLRDATDLYLKQQRLATSGGDRDLKVDKVELSGAVPGENNHETVLPRDGDKVEVELDRPVALSMSVSASTSATG